MRRIFIWSEALSPSFRILATLAQRERASCCPDPRPRERVGEWVGPVLSRVHACDTTLSRCVYVGLCTRTELVRSSETASRSVERRKTRGSPFPLAVARRAHLPFTARGTAERALDFDFIETAGLRGCRAFFHVRSRVLCASLFHCESVSMALSLANISTGQTTAPVNREYLLWRTIQRVKYILNS